MALVHDDETDTVNVSPALLSGEGLHRGHDDVSELMRLLPSAALDDRGPDTGAHVLDLCFGLFEQLFAVGKYKDALAFLTQPLDVRRDQAAEAHRLSRAGRQHDDGAVEPFGPLCFDSGQGLGLVGA